MCTLLKRSVDNEQVARITKLCANRLDQHVLNKFAHNDPSLFSATCIHRRISAENPNANQATTGIPGVIVAEMATSIERLTVSEAVMRMDLSGQPALLFHNNSNGAINLVYVRSDGNIGWIDTNSNAQEATS